jgi:hypothetical protein
MFIYCVIEVTPIIFIVTSVCKSFVIKLIITLAFSYFRSEQYLEQNNIIKSLVS